MKFNVYQSTGTPHDECSEFVQSFDTELEAYEHADMLNKLNQMIHYYVEER